MGARTGGELTLAPAPDGAFALGPLQPDTWTLTIRDEHRLLLARDLQVGAAPIDLGMVSMPESGPLTVVVDNPDERHHAVLRPAGSEAEGGAHLHSATCEDGALRFGDVPFGDYWLELGRSVFVGSISHDVGFDLRHTASGVEPASITFPSK